MTEDVARFLPPPADRDDNERVARLPRSPGWHLSEDDLLAIDALHAVCVDWLAYASDAKTARDIAAMMDCLEAIAAGRAVSAMVEVSIDRKPTGADGLGATIQMSPTMIELSTTEWVWMSPEQGHDHAWSLRAQLNSRGGFSREDLDYWLHLSGFVTDDAETRLSTSLSPVAG